MGWAAGPNGQPIQVGFAYQPHPGMPSGYPPPPQYYGQPPPPPNGTSGFRGLDGHFTRNLIGSVAVSAALLNDTDDRQGFWFVLQDLSVRQEGTFPISSKKPYSTRDDASAPYQQYTGSHIELD